jgi:hypothetical protein
LFRDPNVPVSACDSVTSICSIELPEDIQLGAGEYIWRVRASNGVDHSAFARSLVTIQPTQGEITAGYNWELPEYANDNQHGGLIRGTWPGTEDREATPILPFTPYDGVTFITMKKTDISLVALRAG